MTHILFVTLYVLAVLVILLAMVAAYWWDKWREAREEVERLNAALDARVIRLPAAEEAGKYTAILYQRQFDPLDAGATPVERFYLDNHLHRE